MKIENIKIWQLCLLLGSIILFLPTILIMPAFYKGFNFSNGGQIGDTLGGITAPFINSVAAILVFLAFKEQIKANKLINEQVLMQQFQMQMQRLEDDVFKLSVIKDKIFNNVKNNEDRENGRTKSTHIEIDYLNKATYVTVVFTQMIEITDKIESHKGFALQNLTRLYRACSKMRFGVVN